MKLLSALEIQCSITSTARQQSAISMLELKAYQSAISMLEFKAYQSAISTLELKADTSSPERAAAPHLPSVCEPCAAQAAGRRLHGS